MISLNLISKAALIDKAKIYTQSFTIRSIDNFVNHEGFLIAEKSGELEVLNDILNRGGCILTKQDDLLIKSFTGKIRNINRGIIQAEAGKVLIHESGSIHVDESSLIHGNQGTYLQAQDPIRQESVVSGKGVSLLSKHLDLNSGTLSDVHGLYLQQSKRKKLILKNPLLSRGLMTVSAPQLETFVRLKSTNLLLLSEKLSIQEHISVSRNLFGIGSECLQIGSILKPVEITAGTIVKKDSASLIKKGSVSFEVFKRAGQALIGDRSLETVTWQESNCRKMPGTKIFFEDFQSTHLARQNIHFRFFSLIPTAQHPTIENGLRSVRAACRGGIDNYIDSVFHLDQIIADTAVLTWDICGLGADKCFGSSTKDSKTRNLARWNGMTSAWDSFKKADAWTKAEIFSEFTAAVSAPVGLSKLGTIGRGERAQNYFGLSNSTSPNLKLTNSAKLSPSYELYRKLTSKELNDLAKPADQALINKLSKKGWKIDVARPGTDDWRWLTMVGADASFNTGVPKHILIKEGAPKSALLEEFLHGTQANLGLLKKYGTHQALEVHVKDFMLRHVKLLGLENPHDISLLEQLKIEEINRLGGMKNEYGIF